jgi:FkbM family methyltransferase
MSIARKIYEFIPFKRQLFSLVKRVYLPGFYHRLYFLGEFKIKTGRKSFKMYHHGYLIENEIFWKGLNKSWEPESVKIWQDLCKISNVIFDIGANTGVYSLIAKTVNIDAEVYAFEPVSRTYDKLVKNVRINNYNVKCLEQAISNYDGTGIIYDSLKGNILSVTVNRNLYPDNNFIPVEISTIKLDTFIKSRSIGNIDLLKIDVETHEVEVLEGFREYLKEFQPTMLIEILFDDVAFGVANLIKDIDYVYFNINEKEGPRRVETITKSDNYNYLICKKTVAQQLRLI